LQILSAKNHDPQHAQVNRSTSDGLVIETEFALGGRPINFDVMVAAPDHFAPDEITFLGVADHVRAPNTRNERKVAMR